jgi:DNA repair exonuclease SbcCD ATPase subunit
VSSLSRSIAEKEREVAYLRQDLAAQTTRATEVDAELKSKLIQSQKRISVLESAAQQEAAKAARLEQERDGLKIKVQSLLEVPQQCKALGIHIGSVTASMDATAPLTPPRYSRDSSDNKTAAATSVHQGGISLVKAAASRVAALESELTITRKKAEEYKELSSSLKEANAAKSSQIFGLQAQLAATRSAQDLQKFEELSRHANKLCDELKELRQRSVDPKLLAAAQSEKIAAEARAAAAESSRQAVAAEVKTLRSELNKLQKDTEAAHCAENKVAKLRVALDESKAQEAATRAAAELAEGRCSELQDRLERRDEALRNAQSRCRSLEADLRRLRQLQSLKAAAGAAPKVDRDKEEEASILGNEEIAQLQMQCASMAAHLQKAMELQEAALEAATAATIERDEITDVAIKLKTELEAAKEQLQDAAAAAAAVRYRIVSSTASLMPATEILSASSLSEEVHENLSDDSQSYNTTSPTQEYIQNALSEALKEVDAARCDATEAQIVAQQEREVAEALRRRCAVLEAQVQTLQNDIEMVDIGTSSSSENSTSIETSLRLELERRKQECEDLAAAGAQADAAMRDCVEQLRAATIELQQTRAAAVAARTELHDREIQLESLQNTVEALDRERFALHEQLTISQSALQQQNEGFTASFEAEREAAATEFDALRSNMQALSRQYQDLCNQAAAMQRERDAATQFVEASASQAAFYEQEMRARESALGHAEASCAALIEENRRLQEAIMALQQELAAQACQAQFSNDRAHAALQRRAATAEGSTALVEVRLSDALAEASMLRQQLSVQATRTEELEALLTEERKRQFVEESLNIVNVVNLHTEEEGDNHRLNIVSNVDAVDEAMMQRLSELEIESVQLREELARVQQEAGIKEEKSAQIRKDLADKLDNVTRCLLEEQRKREKLENDARTALLDSKREKTLPPAEDNSTPPPEPLTAPQTNVLQQLSTIAQGLKDIGSR